MISRFCQHFVVTATLQWSQLTLHCWKSCRFVLEGCFEPTERSLCMLETVRFHLLAFGPRSKVQSPTFPKVSPHGFVAWTPPFDSIAWEDSPTAAFEGKAANSEGYCCEGRARPKSEKSFCFVCDGKVSSESWCWPWCFRFGDEATGERVGRFAFKLEGPLPWAQRCRISMPTRCAFAQRHPGTRCPEQQAYFPCAASGTEPRQKDQSRPIYSWSWSKWRRQGWWLDSSGVRELWQGLPGGHPARTTMCSESL